MRNNVNNKKSLALFSFLALVLSGSALGTPACFAQNTLVVNPSVEQIVQNSSGRRPLTPNSAAPAALPDDFQNYTLTPGTSMSFSVFGAPEMTFPLIVDKAGEVTVPLIGKVHVAGDTVQEAENKIEERLIQQHIFVPPVVVSLELSGYTPENVIVGGEVQVPGRVALFAPKSIADVISLAGGETLAAGAEVIITHPSGQAETVSYYAHGDVRGAQTMVGPGDSVFVKRAGVVYILGAVTRPGGYLMSSNGQMSLSQAVAFAQGTTMVASSGTALIIRRNGDGNQVMQIRVPLKKTEQGKTDSIPLRDGDIVDIQTSAVKEFLVTTSGLLAAVATSVVYAVYR